jgi:4-carboxymuconolactone decarboxylase
MARYREIALEEMTPAQRRVHDQIVAGRRGRFGGPFQLLIRAPEICEPAAQLGEHLRWGTSLPDCLSELRSLRLPGSGAHNMNGTHMPR